MKDLLSNVGSGGGAAAAGGAAEETKEEAKEEGELFLSDAESEEDGWLTKSMCCREGGVG